MARTLAANFGTVVYSILSYPIPIAVQPLFSHSEQIVAQIDRPFPPAPPPPPRRRRRQRNLLLASFLPPYATRAISSIGRSALRGRERQRETRRFVLPSPRFLRPRLREKWIRKYFRRRRRRRHRWRRRCRLGSLVASVEKANPRVDSDTFRLFQRLSEMTFELRRYFSFEGILGYREKLP